MNDEDIILGYVMGYNHGINAGLSIGGTADTDDWQPPDDWLTVPEPTAYEMYFLIEITDVSSTDTNYFRVSSCRPSDGQTGWGVLSIDWGDGTVDTYAEFEWNSYNTKHIYSAAQQYIVKVTTTNQSNLFYSVTPDSIYSVVLMAKLGSEIVLKSDGNSSPNCFKHQTRLHYISWSGIGGLPDVAFGFCYSLRKHITSTPLTKLNPYVFEYCYNILSLDLSAVTEIGTYALSQTPLKKLILPVCTTIDNYGLCSMPTLEKLELPVCTSIGNYGLQNSYTLKEVYAPLCTNVSERAFSDNYALSKVTFADDCIYGEDAFDYCCNLYPKPNGSTN